MIGTCLNGPSQKLITSIERKNKKVCAACIFLASSKRTTTLLRATYSPRSGSPLYSAQHILLEADHHSTPRNIFSSKRTTTLLRATYSPRSGPPLYSAQHILLEADHHSTPRNIFHHDSRMVCTVQSLNGKTDLKNRLPAIFDRFFTVIVLFLEQLVDGYSPVSLLCIGHPH